LIPGQIVTRMFTALISGDDQTYFALVTDDFEFSGPLPVAVSAEGWFSLTRLITLAFPDIEYNFQVVKEQGDEVHFVTQLSGTHLGELDLTPLGMSVNPPTGKRFSIPGMMAQPGIKLD
jgi:predicted ester cyclase